MKPKAAIFALSSCEGCSLIVLNLEERLVRLMGSVEFVNFREAMDDRRDDYDIAIIDGTATREPEVAKLREIRAQAKVLVAMGSCAVQGGIYTLKNSHGIRECVSEVYGDPEYIDTLPVKGISAYVPVDYNIYGCPITRKEFVEVMRSILLGKKADIPSWPICNECRPLGNVCVYERGLACMGPVTRAGCEAICPAHGTGCCGCRGLFDNPPIDQHRAIMLEHGFSEEAMEDMYGEFNNSRKKT